MNKFATCWENFPADFFICTKHCREFLHIGGKGCIIIIESKDQEQPLETYLEARMFISEKHQDQSFPLRLSPLMCYREQTISRKSFSMIGPQRFW